MLAVVKKVTSKVVFKVKDIETEFENGKEAYDAIKGNYIIKFIYIKNDDIVFELDKINDSKDWQKDYIEQFGEEPSFF